MDPFFRTIPGMLDAIEDSEEVRNAFTIAAWKRVAGSQIAERSAPLGLEERRLVIAVGDKTWQRNLGSLAPQLLFKLNAILGGSRIDFIEFRIDPSVLKSERDVPVARDKDEENTSLPPEVVSASAAIRDEKLRMTVLRAASNCLARKQRPKE